MIPRPLQNALCAALIMVSGTGCSLQVTPGEREWQQARPAVDAPLWSEMSEVRTDDWYALLNLGPGALDWRLRAIESATSSIDLQTFLWEDDYAGRLVHERLRAAADRGVKVRILVDDSFLIQSEASFAALASHPNVSGRIYNPFPNRPHNLIARQALNLAAFSRLNHRMHNKLMVVDGQVALLGGRNLADHYFGFHQVANFRDLEVLVGGSDIVALSQGFDTYWNDEWAVEVERVLHSGGMGASPVDPMEADSTAPLESVMESPQERRLQWRELVKGAAAGEAELILDEPDTMKGGTPESPTNAIATAVSRLLDEAEKEVWLVSAYFIPTPEFEAAVQRAEDRGVSVRVLTNSIRSNNHLAAHSAYRKHIGRLLDHGADLHELRVDAGSRSDYMVTPISDKHLALHAKVIVVDHDKVFVGSPNLDPRSLRLNTEMGLLIHSATLNHEVRTALTDDFALENAWKLSRSDSGQIQWESDDAVRSHQPSSGVMQEFYDFLLMTLPIEGEM